MDGTRAAMRRPALLLALATMTLGATCPQVQGPPPPRCPEAPIAADPLGEPSPRAGRSSARFEARGLYLAALVHGALAPRLADDPTAPIGVDQGTFRLLEATEAQQRINRVTMQFSVWARGQDGGHVDLPGRTYTLRLRLRPHLITRQNTPDADTRRLFLGCDPGAPCDAGLVVAFAFDGMLGGGQRGPAEVVDCHSSNYDLIDEGVLARTVKAVAELRPLGVSLDSVMELLATRLGLDAHLVGMDLGTDQHLVVGLLLDVGAPAPFDSFAASFSRGDDVDWALRIDTALLVPAIRGKVAEIAAAQGGGIRLTQPAAVQFVPEGVRAQIKATFAVPVCGDVPFSATTTMKPGVCGNVLGACADVPAPVVSPSSSSQGTCVDLAKTGKSIVDGLDALGRWLAGGPTPPPAPSQACARIAGPLLFPVGGDVVYPVRFDTDGVFSVLGRSQLMDNRHPGRTPPPLAGCAW
jgi:hypothetical protein